MNGSQIVTATLISTVLLLPIIPIAALVALENLKVKQQRTAVVVAGWVLTLIDLVAVVFTSVAYYDRPGNQGFMAFFMAIYLFIGLCVAGAALGEQPNETPAVKQ